MVFNSESLPESALPTCERHRECGLLGSQEEATFFVYDWHIV
jgi:hypothetical protein